MNNYLFQPPPIASLPIQGIPELFAVRRMFFVARNYQAHAMEMGQAVDKQAEPLAFFTKSTTALTPGGSTVSYPPRTQNYHHEVELVVALGKPGFQVQPDAAANLIYGYACGLDMTRRDLQQAAKAQGKPWDAAKDVENSAVCSAIMPKPGQVLTEASIQLEVNGEQKQQDNINNMIWTIPEIIAELSTYYHLEAGDLIFTGTPEGVGPVHQGDRITARVAGVAELHLTIA